MSPAPVIRLQYAVTRAEFELDVAVNIPLHGITGVFGVSGAGKTTLLRCIAGLEDDARGTLIVGDDIWQDDVVCRPVHEREIAYVFQEPRLFGHLTVAQNIEYGLRRRKAGVSPDSVVQLLGLEALLERRPAALSGGEAQRVAIARALLAAPRFVLMDEPLASLDDARRQEILPFLDRLHSQTSVPIIYVSHNLDEICRLCDHLVILDSGRLIADGELQSVLVRTDIAQIAGAEAGSVIDATIEQTDDHYALTLVSFSGGSLWLPNRIGEPGEQLRLRIRANDVSLSRERAASSSIINMLDVEIEHIEETSAASQLVRLIAGQDRLVARITRRSCRELKLRAGLKLIAQIKSVAVRQPVGA